MQHSQPQEVLGITPTWIIRFLFPPLNSSQPNPNRAVNITSVGYRKESMLSSCFSGHLHHWAGAESQGHLLASVWQGRGDHPLGMARPLLGLTGD